MTIIPLYPIISRLSGVMMFQVPYDMSFFLIINYLYLCSLGHIDAALKQESSTPILLFGPKFDPLLSLIPRRGSNCPFFFSIWNYLSTVNLTLREYLEYFLTSLRKFFVFNLTLEFQLTAFPSPAFLPIRSHRCLSTEVTVVVLRRDPVQVLPFPENQEGSPCSVHLRSRRK